LDSERGNSVGRLYTAAFGRIPDSGGLSYWVNQLDSNAMSQDDITGSFVNSNEFFDRFSNDEGIMTNEGVLTNMYLNVFGRTPDANGYSYWMNSLDSYAISFEGLLSEFANSLENRQNFNSMMMGEGLL